MAWSKQDATKIWPSKAGSRAKGFEDEFKVNLRKISEGLASHDRSSHVGIKHVDHAFDALSAAGLRNRRFSDRPESLMTAGAFLVGFAWACPDMITLFVSPEKAKSISLGVLIAFFVTGVILWLFGWCRTKLPSPPSSVNTISAKIQRWVVRLLWVAAFLGVAYMGCVRFFYACPNCGGVENANKTAPTQLQPEPAPYPERPSAAP